jgi:hypothetical protein
VIPDRVEVEIDAQPGALGDLEFAVLDDVRLDADDLDALR